MIDKLKAVTLEHRKARSVLGPVLQYHLSEVTNIGKNKQRETTEDEAIQYIKKTVSKLESDEYANPQEIAVLNSILPQMASEEDVKAFLEGLDANMNKGQIMKAVREEFGALVDMKMVSGLV